MTTTYQSLPNGDVLGLLTTSDGIPAAAGRNTLQRTILQNIGVGSVTITPTSGTIGGAATFVLATPGDSVTIMPDGGTDYRVISASSATDASNVNVALTAEIARATAAEATIKQGASAVATDAAIALIVDANAKTALQNIMVVLKAGTIFAT